MKKTLAILLSLALVICMIPATAFAEGEIDISTATVSDVNTGEYVYDPDSAYNLVPIVKIGTETTLSSGTDYNVEYKKDGATYDGNKTSVKDVGVYVVEITGNGSYAGKITKTLTIKAVDLSNASITLSDSTGLTTDMNEDTIKSKIVVKQDGQSLNSKVYTLRVEGAQSASVTVTATSKLEASGNNIKDSTSKPATFTAKTDLTGHTTVSISGSYTYKGSKWEPNPVVQYQKDESSAIIPLNKGVDYGVSYSNNIDQGTATVTVTGMGSYTGTATGTFTIGRKSIKTGIGISITVSSAIDGGTPGVVVKDGTTLLKEGTDYTLSYAPNGSSAGYVTITGANNYMDDVVKSYDIVDSAHAFNNTNTAIYLNGTQGDYRCYYNGKEQKPTVTVYFNGTPLSSTYYDVTYSNNTKPSLNTKVTITGKNGYGGSVEKTFTILETPITFATISGYSSSYGYTGLPITPVVTVVVNGVTLTRGVDYDVTYTNNTSISTTYSKAKITVTAKTGSGYTGSATAEFTIAGKSIAGCNAYFTDGRSTAAYTGSVIKPNITVKDGYYTVLKEFTDYTVSYKNSAGKIVTSLKDAGTYTVVITGKGNYSGEISPLTFTITGTDISGYTVTLKDASVNATGYAQTPVITSVKKGYYYSLTSNDYTVTYQDSTGKTVTSMSAPGTYKVVVTGKNGYSGSTYATFRIVGLPQTVTVTQNSYKVYATSDSFKITAKASGDATGFTYTSSNPTVASVSSTGYVTMHKVGRAVITVTATGMKKYDPAYETVEVKVYPKKAVQTKKPWTDGKKGQAKVRWTYQDGATSYQVRYSRDKNFGAGTYKTKTVKAHGKDYTTQSTTLTSLKSKSTYYIKVRAVYTDSVTGDTYYGAWSGWRSVKTK